MSLLTQTVSEKPGLKWQITTPQLIALGLTVSTVGLLTTILVIGHVCNID